MTIHIYPHLLSISSPFPGILLDAYGVFWGGNDLGLLAGSKDTMDELVASGKIVGILSNSTQLSDKEIDKLKLYGLVQGIHYHFLITSGQIARNLFQAEALPFPTPNKKYLSFGPTHPKFTSAEALFHGTPYKETKNPLEADFIYISIPHINGEDQIDPEVFRQIIKKLKALDLPILCANPDKFAFEGNPPKPFVRQGSIATIFEELGSNVFYVGKPSSPAFSEAMKQFCDLKVMTPADVLMVGDTTETDIRGANNFGMKSALVTETGITAHRILQEGLENIIKKLPTQDVPDFFIRRLAYHDF